LVFQDSEGNMFEIAKVAGIAKTRLHHLHFDAVDLPASAAFYQKFLNCTVEEPKSGAVALTLLSGQCVIINQVDELSEVTKATWRGRHFALNVTDDNFHAIVDKLHAAGIEERDDHGEREGRRDDQLGTYFREPSGFRLQITNEDSATFAAHLVPLQQETEGIGGDRQVGVAQAAGRMERRVATGLQQLVLLAKRQLQGPADPDQYVAARIGPTRLDEAQVPGRNPGHVGQPQLAQPAGPAPSSHDAAGRVEFGGRD
jgi:extradiol dioxygenase family protein